ncbi:MAG TPA: hypothetical protein VKS01_01885 [Bryobacteraceae bacterium]|nr:hypothetical protein [Bryobacteraceae bacterium]
MTIRRLPDGPRQSARITNRTIDHITLIPSGENANEMGAGSLVEIDGVEGFYLGEIVALQAESKILVAIEHFVDRAALAEIESVWKPASGE